MSVIINELDVIVPPERSSERPAPSPPPPGPTPSDVRAVLRRLAERSERVRAD